MKSSPLCPHGPSQGFHTFSFVCYNYSEGSRISGGAKVLHKLQTAPVTGTVRPRSECYDSVFLAQFSLYPCLNQLPPPKPNLLLLANLAGGGAIAIASTLPKGTFRIKTSSDHPCEINSLTQSETFSYKLIHKCLT